MNSSATRVANDIAQRVHAVVAAAVGQHQRRGVVHAHEALNVATRRTVEPLGTAGGQYGERRSRDEGAVVWSDAPHLLDRGGLAGQAVDGFHLVERGDDRHDRLLIGRQDPRRGVNGQWPPGR
jgi:hypothetical protein